MTGSGREEAETQKRMQAAKAKLAQDVQQKLQADKADKAPAAAVQSSKASDGDVDERDRRMEAAASAPSRAVTSPAKAKSGIVTKEQLAKSGLTLRDYMNKQKGLTRRDGKAPAADQTKSDKFPKASGAMIQSMDTDMMRTAGRTAAKEQGAKYAADRKKSANQAAFERAQAEAKTPEGKAKLDERIKGQALERVSPEEYIGPAFGLKTLSKLAKKLATPKVKEYNPKMLPAPKAASKVDTKALPAPTKRLEYDKKGALDARRKARAEKNRSEMLEENAKRYGLDPKSPGYDSAAKSVQKDMGGKDFSFKKGGRVSASKMGSSSSSGAASKRADGIAQRGKTRCKVY
jgi:hypothetical protein